MVRIGVLGAARTAPLAVVRPASRVTAARVVAIAARDQKRAARFAAKYGIGSVRTDYEALLADPDVNTVYIPLPNGHHAHWAVAALAAGKHVLCEKPFTANEAEASRVSEAADSSGLVVMEAFHYRYHPLAQRMREIVESGELGVVRHVEAWNCFPLPLFSDIRYRYDLAGGALMDAGCYAVHMVRFLGGEEPEVTTARAKLHNTDVDRAMTAELRFPSGHTGRITCSMWSSSLLHIAVRVIGDRGEMRAVNPITPQLWHRLTVTANGRKRTERLTRRSTYEYQLNAFCDAVLNGTPIPTPPSDSIANMRIIDAIYMAAGMRLRGG